MANIFEENLDKLLLVIVPVDGHSPGHITEWQTRVVGVDRKSMATKIPGTDLKMADLDKRQLTFRNHAGPAARYLYFH